MEQEAEVKQLEVENTTPIESTVTQPQAETQDQINWKKFREQREIERRENEAAKKRAEEKEAEANALKQAMEAILNKPQQSNNQYEQEESEDDRIQKKVNAALIEREKKMDQERKQREHAEFPNRLNQVYNDFNQVCTSDNLDYLEYHYPEVAEAFKHAPDGFDKWSAVYKAVKRFVPNTDSKKDQKKSDNNMAKPQSMSSPGVAQTGDTAPMQLDDKRRADNWSRMQRVMRSG